MNTLQDASDSADPSAEKVVSNPMNVSLNVPVIGADAELAVVIVIDRSPLFTISGSSPFGHMRNPQCGPK
jgi:hypothetical protein